MFAKRVREAEVNGESRAINQLSATKVPITIFVLLEFRRVLNDINLQSTVLSKHPMKEIKM